jgi:hypothetical protein
MVIAIVTSGWGATNYTLRTVSFFFGCRAYAKKIGKEGFLFLFFDVFILGFMKSLAPLSPIDYFRCRLVAIRVFDPVLLVQW